MSFMRNNYWLHRISHHAEVSYPLLEKNYLSIGFSDFAYEGFVENVLNGGDTQEERWKMFDEIVEDIWGEKKRTRHNLWRYIEGFKKGDLIIVPGSGVFSIYEIVAERPKRIGEVNLTELRTWNDNVLIFKDGLLYSTDEKLIDLGFVWEVKPIHKNISRYDYADSLLTSRMKIRSTNANIYDLSSSIEKAVYAFNKNKPINIHSQLIESIAPNILLSLKQELTPDKLECLVKWYFERIGANDVYIPPKNEKGKEGDADVIATFEFIKLIIYCQVKFHNGQTDDWAVKQILDYKNRKASINTDDNSSMDDEYSRLNWVISSGDGFSEQSINTAKQEKIQLIDGLKFSRMLLEAGMLNLNKAF